MNYCFMVIKHFSTTCRNILSVISYSVRSECASIHILDLTGKRQAISLSFYLLFIEREVTYIVSGHCLFQTSELQLFI